MKMDKKPTNMNDHSMMMAKDFRHRFFISLMISIPILILSPMIQMFLGVNWHFEGDKYWLLGLSTILFLYGGKPFFAGAAKELENKNPAMMTLIAMAIGTAYIYSAATVLGFPGTDFFWELATLIVIMLLGHWIEMKSVMGASKSLQNLADLIPQKAHLILANGEVEEVNAASLKKGDRVLVTPGERIAVDGKIYEGKTDVNEAMITGESVPVPKNPGDKVIGGTINGDGAIRFEVSDTIENSFISQVIKMVREAQASKSKTQRLMDLAAKWLFYIATSTGLITLLFWMADGAELSFAIQRAVTVIIIACPHALGLAAPLVTAISTDLAAANGLLIRNRSAFENARKLNIMVFDKTGTLTEGKFGVEVIKPVRMSENELLSFAAAAEKNSEHPIAKGIVAEAKSRNLRDLKATDFENMPGIGVKAIIAGTEILMVRPKYLEEKKIDFDRKEYENLAAAGKTIVFVIQDNQNAGLIALADIVRPNAEQTIHELKQMQVKSIMISGDNQKAAEAVAQKLGIDKVFAGILPQNKAEIIGLLQQHHDIVGMTGDGVNDAPALAKADLGIAIGAGTDVAMQTADVILVKSNPLDVIKVLKLSKQTYKKLVQNLIWATGYNIIALPLAAGVLYNQGIMISPAFGAVLMSLSTVIVAINAKTLKL